jgi:hypothetical protein
MSAGASKIGLSAPSQHFPCCVTLRNQLARRSAVCAALRPITVDAHLRAQVETDVAVEKGTKAVTSASSSVYRERTFNDLRTNFVVEIPWKEFFSSHG